MDFYPRPPRGGRRDAGHQIDVVVDISIHALREEGDQPLRMLYIYDDNFYPRPPRGGRRIAPYLLTDYIRISIHALREEGDLFWDNFVKECANFYPRPPRGGRLTGNGQDGALEVFLSTPSARRATRCKPYRPEPGAFLSTPSARRATGAQPLTRWLFDNFYPRPPRGGRPSFPRCCHGHWAYFYPRPPRGGRPESR